MEKTPTSPEYDRFTNLVDRVMSVPKAQVQRIAAQTPAPSKSKPTKRNQS